jgi:predicted Zn-dependent protease
VSQGPRDEDRRAQLAGALAHKIGHVRRRHSVQGQKGISTEPLAGLFESLVGAHQSDLQGGDSLRQSKCARANRPRAVRGA